MKGLNNRGFAISTLLYGLMIMSLMIVLALISNLGTTRSSTTGFVDKIEDELNRLSITNTKGDYVGGEVDNNGREYIAKVAGWYKIELWGASGGSSGGLGAYTSGIIYLESNSYIYFYVGQQGGSADTFNSGSTGGGATDVRLVSGEWNSSESLDSRIMVAAGGGSSGAGGTLVGSGSSPGTQSTGAGFGVASSSGGGGYYGSSDTGGGSSFIMGYAGVRTQSGGSATSQTNKTFSIHRGDYDADGNMITEDYTPVVYNGLIVPGVHSGNGKFKITRISGNDSNTPPGRGSNSDLNQVQYIRDCVDANSTDTTGYWLEIQAIQNGKNLATQTGVNVTGTGGTLTDGDVVVDGSVDDTSSVASISGSGAKCVQVKLPSAQDLDEVAVWHQYKDSLSFKGHTLSVSTDGSTWRNIREKSTDTNTVGVVNEVETANGIRYNSFHSSALNDVVDGNYYIFSANSDNKVLTDAEESSGGVARMDTFTGESNQIWHVYKFTATDGNQYYRLVNNSSGKALMVSATNSNTGVMIALGDNDTNNSTQNWHVSSLKNGYYTISTYLGVRIGFDSSGSPSVVTQSNTQETTQRWKFVLANY